MSDRLRSPARAPRHLSAARVPEAFIAWLWEHRRMRRGVRTTDGRRLQVIYPGRRMGAWGPDFRGALLVIDGSLARGDVEVHVRPREWHIHGHDTDRAYAAVVLHVVYQQEASLPVVRADGVLVPTLALADVLQEPVPDLLALWVATAAVPPPVAACRPGEDGGAILDRAGMDRFEAKRARFEADLTCVDPPQVLWTGLLECLGYAVNRAPFRALAERVPLAEAQAIAREQGQAALEAILLGEAGLLPSQRGQLPLDCRTWDIEDVWRALRRTGPGVALGWRRVGCRPGNGPVRRVAAAASLIVDGPQLAGEFEGAIVSELLAGRPQLVCRTLRRLLTRAGDAYWRTHDDLGRPLPRPCALIGSSRAADAVVNAAFPWAAALARREAQPALEWAAAAAYHAHPLLPHNQITRHMARQLLGERARSIVTSARRQQGLIHIYRHWCDARECRACPAGAAGSAPQGVW